MRMLDRASIEDAKVSAHYLDQIRRIQADIDAGIEEGKTPQQVVQERYRTQDMGPPGSVLTEKGEETTSTTRSRRQGGPNAPRKRSERGRLQSGCERNSRRPIAA